MRCSRASVQLLASTASTPTVVVMDTTDTPSTARLEVFVDGEPMPWREVALAVRDGTLDVERTEVRITTAAP